MLKMLFKNASTSFKKVEEILPFLRLYQIWILRDREIKFLPVVGHTVEQLLNKKTAHFPAVFNHLVLPCTRIKNINESTYLSFHKGNENSSRSLYIRKEQHNVLSHSGPIVHCFYVAGTLIKRLGKPLTLTPKAATLQIQSFPSLPRTGDLQRQLSYLLMIRSVGFKLKTHTKTEFWLT